MPLKLTFNPFSGNFDFIQNLSGLNNRLTNLENNEYKITYFTTITSASGTITPPTGATILLQEFPYSVSAYVSQVDSNGEPTGVFPKTSLGATVVVSSFDSLGNYTLSGTPSSFPCALIYVFKIKAIDYSNCNINNILEVDRNASIREEINALKPYLVDFTKTTSTGASFNQTVVRSYLIPAGTFKTGDQIRISMRISRPASQTSNSQYFIRWSYDNVAYTSMTSFGAINASTRFARMYRHYDIVNQVNLTESVGSAAQIFTDDTTSTTAINPNNMNWTQDVYLGIGLTQPVTSDSSTIDSVVIQIFRP
jgi:hypothetical protein